MGLLRASVAGPEPQGLAVGWAVAVLVGAAVKLVDALVDEEPGSCPGPAASWVLVLMATACALQLRLAASLAMAAWVVGMAATARPQASGDPRPGRGIGAHLGALSRGLEAAAAGLGAAALLGAGEVLASVLALGAIQATDNLLDREEDHRLPGQTQVVAGAAVALFALGAYVDPGRLGVAMAAVPFARLAAEGLGCRPGLLGSAPATDPIRWAS